MKLPTDERIKDFAERQRPATRGALLPVWPLPAALQLAARRPARQFAGHLERQHEPAVGQQIHHQHQHRDELLARRARATSASASSRCSGMVQDLTETGARTAKMHYGAGGWVAHHNTDLWRAAGADRRAVGALADRRRLALPESVGTLPVHRRPRFPGTPLPGHERRRAVLPRYARRGAEAPLARHLPVRVAGKRILRRHSVCAGPTMDKQIIRDLFSNCIRASEILGVDADFRQSSLPRAPGWRRIKSARQASSRNGWKTGTWKRPTATTATSRTSTASSPARRSPCAARRNWRPR